MRLQVWEWREGALPWTLEQRWEGQWQIKVCFWNRDSLGKSFRTFHNIIFPRAFDGTTPRVPSKLTSSVKFEGVGLPYKRLKSLICEILLNILSNPIVNVSQAMLASVKEYTYKTSYVLIQEGTQNFKVQQIAELPSMPFIICRALRTVVVFS